LCTAGERSITPSFVLAVKADDRAQSTGDRRARLAAVLEVTGEVFDVDAADVERPVWCCQHQRVNWRRYNV